jgi:hypothetical protein
MEIQDSEQDSSRASEIQELVQKHKNVFQDLPMELPPERRIEHVIEVNTGSSPIKVRPMKKGLKLLAKTDSKLVNESVYR